MGKDLKQDLFLGLIKGNGRNGFTKSFFELQCSDFPFTRCTKKQTISEIKVSISIYTSTAISYLHENYWMHWERYDHETKYKIVSWNVIKLHRTYYRCLSINNAVYVSRNDYLRKSNFKIIYSYLLNKIYIQKLTFSKYGLENSVFKAENQLVPMFSWRAPNFLLVCFISAW